MNNCVLDENARCRVCGRHASGLGVKRNCRAGDSKDPPGTFRKAFNFASSAVRHVAAGMPLATEHEVGRRYSICRQCEHYTGTACRKCGCRVSGEKAFLSKLSWAHEKCPVGKWGGAD